MKTVLIDIKDMSDSVEIYESKPAKALIYSIYTIVAVFLAAIFWSCLFKLDDHVKANGIIKGNDNIYNITSAVTGKINEKNVSSGDYVNEGDVLYSISIESLGETIANYQNNLSDINDRLDILNGYEEALTDEKDLSADLKYNKYYDEFLNRYNLLKTTIDVNTSTNTSKEEINKFNQKYISESITDYNNKIANLNKVKEDMLNKTNSFNVNDSYYYSLVESFLSSYYLKEESYNTSIANIDAQIATLESDDGTLVNLKSQKEQLNSEKTRVLEELENTAIANIEQMIMNYNENITSLKVSLTSSKIEETSLASSVDTRELVILTEKNKIAEERLAYEEKKKECENYLKSYNIKNDNCVILANKSGYYYETNELNIGSYIDETSSLGAIYPEKNSSFYAEIYLKNSDIGQIKEGQKVKLEITSFPSSEYGYLDGEIVAIAKDITVDKSSGQAYYLVKVQVNNFSLVSNEKEEVSLKNGMACEAKIVTGQRRVIKYILHKIKLID